jgi:Carboxypeptidase regulatory-like domain
MKGQVSAMRGFTGAAAPQGPTRTGHLTCAVLQLAVVLALSALLLGGLGAGRAQALLAPVKLGSPPESCIDAAPSLYYECIYGDPPKYMGYTYIGGLRISPHIIHEGEVATESFYPLTVKCISGQPCASSWSWEPPGEEISGCGLGGVSTDLTCTFKAIGASAYPPSEKSSGWSGGWEVDTMGICGFNGCADAFDYYYIVPGNLRGLSGTVTGANGQPLVGATVYVSGAGGSESTEVNPENGSYSFILPPGSYDVSVVPAGGGPVNPTQCTHGTIQGEDCIVDLSEKDGSASFVQGESVSIVGTPKVAEPESGGSNPEQFKIALTEAAAAPETVAWQTQDGSATVAAQNYAAKSGVVTIPAGARSVPVSVEVLPGSGASTAPALVYYAKITSVKGEATLNQAAAATVGTIVVPTVAGKITEPDATRPEGVKPVEGATVTLTGKADTGQSVTRTERSDASGEYSFSVDPGTYEVSVKGKQQVFTVKECEGSTINGSAGAKTVCKVTPVAGSETYKANFTSGCVIPDPGGGPLPAETPNPIPGAKTYDNLEAVGCWKTSDGGNTWTSTQNVRLDGIDVVPIGSSTITLSSDAIVTSDGPVSIQVAGQQLYAPAQLDMDFAGVTLQAADLGTGNPTFGFPSLAGFPIAVNTGGSLQTLLPPWQSSVGKTAASLNIQLPIPLSASSWDVGTGAFMNAGKQVPSVGAVFKFTATNREGLVAPEICAKYTGAPFEIKGVGDKGASAEISQATACYDLHGKRWTLTALMQLPFEKGFQSQSKANVSVSFPGGSGPLLGLSGALAPWDWDTVAAELDGLQKQLGYGFFLQRLGVKFTTNETTSAGGTAGISFGPQLENAEFMSLDGEVLWGITTEPSFLQFKGSILMLRNTPFQTYLSGGYVKFSSERIDLGGQLVLEVPIVHWGLNGTLSGFMAQSNGANVQLVGNLDVKGWGQNAVKVKALLANSNIVLCYSKNGTYAFGGVLELKGLRWKPSAPNTCDVGKYELVGFPPGSASAASAHAAAGGGSIALPLRGGLSGVTIAVQGKSAAPAVRLRGPGVTLTTPARGQLLNGEGAIIEDAANRTTYVSLFAPRGGRWQLSALPGSSAIASVSKALPAPRARVKARVGGSLCRRTLTYDARVPAGESVALYAQGANKRVLVGYARAGHHRVPFAAATDGHGSGQVLALESNHGLPRSQSTIATFAVTQLTKPQPVSGVKLSGHTLTWSAACGAASYKVTVRSGKHTTTLRASTTRVTLGALHGAIAVSVVAVNSAGKSSRALTRKYRI